MSRRPNDTETEVDPITVETDAVTSPAAKRAEFPDNRGLAPAPSLELPDNRGLAPARSLELPDDRGLAPAREDRPYRPDRERERIRGWLALALACMLAAVLLVSWGEFAVGTRSVDEIADMLQATLAPLIGLVGAATGFYFGDRR